jgi:comEA protein
MLNLEKHERLVVICLVLMLVLGLLVMVYKRSSPAIRVSIGHYHYDADTGTSGKSSLYRGRVSNEAGDHGVNINTADAALLETINGIGKALASRIIEYRKRHGMFISKEEIKKVGGIGDKLYEKIKDMIRIE